MIYYQLIWLDCQTELLFLKSVLDKMKGCICPCQIQRLYSWHAEQVGLKDVFHLKTILGRAGELC